jgi:hypothetical protein
VKTFHEEDDVMHLIADDLAFQLARDRRQRLLVAYDEHRRRRRLRRRPPVPNLPGGPLDAA